MVRPLSVPLELRALEVDVAQIAGAVSFGLIVKMA
jgi:hypothetical protein